METTSKATIKRSALIPSYYNVYLDGQRLGWVVKTSGHPAWQAFRPNPDPRCSAGIETGVRQWTRADAVAVMVRYERTGNPW